jgi:opacity protein-like surface antigen
VWHPKNHGKGWNKMTIQHKTWALALITCMLAAPALADDSDTAYVAFNLGRGTLLHGCSSPAVGGSCWDNKGDAYFFTYGYQYTPMWGLEANFGKTGNVSSTGGGLQAVSLTVEAVATLPMSENFSVFVKGGIGYTNFTPNAIGPAFKFTPSATSPAGGAGLQYYFTPKLALLLQADYFGGYSPIGGAPRVNILVNSIGLKVRY